MQLNGSGDRFAQFPQFPQMRAQPLNMPQQVGGAGRGFPMQMPFGGMRGQLGTAAPVAAAPPVRYGPTPGRGQPAMHGVPVGAPTMRQMPYTSPDVAMAMMKSAGMVPVMQSNPMLVSKLPNASDGKHNDSQQDAPFDMMNDFPALSGHAVRQGGHNDGDLFKRAATGLKQQDLIAPAPVGFQITQEDFPALSGGYSQQPMQSSGPVMTQGFAGGDPFRSGSDLRSAADTSSHTESYGMMGLLGVVRMENQHLNLLALGTDLTALGLNLNSSDSLYSTFGSPFSEQPLKREPDFKLPQCYYMQPPFTAQSATAKTAHFSDETLFYIFYAMPGDAIQLAAAQELQHREWRYHKEQKAWFTRVPNTDPIVKTTSYERGSYYYFDVPTWSRQRRDNFMLQYDALDIPQPPKGSGQTQ
eukprot:TRINITY_DN15283_c0_g1_i1.p1 TRINITY_DN15283_c0_g1~~TRINITY_DN15283_c0_g1_i1.p1  ORF type:complete len:414 (+),score=48.86 TRINITY_DN15283_c0_g1_i1:106-1347(+)